MDSSVCQIQYENDDEEEDVDMKTKMKLVVPNGCCGAIIGKGGATIKY